MKGRWHRPLFRSREEYGARFTRHEFDVLGESFTRCPALREASTLAELAERLWAVD